MLKKITLIASSAILLASPLTFINAPSAHSESVGTSCADCPSYSGSFSIENSTNTTVSYQVRWGNKHQWKKMVLASGQTMKHSYPLGENPHAKVPQPYVRFDNVGGDGRITLTEYKMKFHATGYAGYGPKVNTTQPKAYFFQYAADGRQLDLLAR
jgi:hypothetical protein